MDTISLCLGGCLLSRVLATVNCFTYGGIKMAKRVLDVESTGRALNCLIKLEDNCFTPQVRLSLAQFSRNEAVNQCKPNYAGRR